LPWTCLANSTQYHSSETEWNGLGRSSSPWSGCSGRNLGSPIVCRRKTRRGGSGNAVQITFRQAKTALLAAAPALLGAAGTQVGSESGRKRW